MTLSPEVGPGDAAEWALQAHRLGVRHPPGYSLHTILGFLIQIVVSDPARATNFLSAATTAMAVGLLSRMVLTITRQRLIAFLAPLGFAILPTVWDSAVSTEVYNVNICFVAAAMFVTLKWYGRRSARRALLAGALVGLSFGASMANGLLLPGWCVLVWRRSRGRRGDLLTAFAGAIVVGFLLLSWAVFRSRSHPPLGTEYLPHRAADLWPYVTAAQYRTAGFQPFAFYVERLWEHLRLFSASFLWLGLVVAMIGVKFLWMRHRRIALAMILMFTMNMAYFTWYPWPDYYEMVTPSYFITMLAFAAGLESLHRWKSKTRVDMLAKAVTFIVVTTFLMTGLKDHLSRKGRTPVTDLVTASFEVFAPDAVVVSVWDTFAPMLYFQEVHDLRTDLRIVEWSGGARNYKWGTVTDSTAFAMRSVSKRPVYVERLDRTLVDSCTWQAVSPIWKRVVQCDAASD
ncbi:MAG: DUF2723 domain-containing protein [Planctomycetes bacterium]|nr:DUF2723 domain-containing protein [Planctomycetota bacterium]